MRVFSILLLLLTGTVFINSPAELLAKLTPDSLGFSFWLFVIIAYYVVATLLHEMVHYYNYERGVQDCSRGNTYHNKHFRDAAEARGLHVERSDKYGWAITEPTEELLDFVAKRLIETLGCQHVLLHRNDGTRQDWFPDDEHTYCNKCVDCPLKTADPALFSHNGNVVLNDENISDFPLPENCPTRILIARRIFFEGDEWGKIGTLFTGDAYESLGFCEELLEQVANVISVCLERKARNMVIKRQNEEVVRINRQLQLARDRAVAAENARSYFFSCISHDVRTPLNAIIGYTELLKKGVADEAERDNACDAITTSGRSLLQLISSMVDLAKLESDTLVIEPVMTDLNVQAGKVLRSFDVSVAGRAVRLRGASSRGR